MKRLLLFLILLLGHAARSKGQTSGPPQDGMRHAAETTSETNETQYDRQNTPQPSLPQRPPDKQPAAATRPKTAYANRR